MWKISRRDVGGAQWAAHFRPSLRIRRAGDADTTAGSLKLGPSQQGSPVPGNPTCGRVPGGQAAFVPCPCGLRSSLPHPHLRPQVAPVRASAQHASHSLAVSSLLLSFSLPCKSRAWGMVYSWPLHAQRLARSGTVVTPGAGVAFPRSTSLQVVTWRELLDRPVLPQHD